MRQTVSSVLEIVGIVTVLVAGFVLSVWFGVLLLGAGAVLVGYALGGSE